MIKQRETDLVRACLDYLGVRGVFCWRNNTGAVKTDKRFIRYGAVGSPDIIGILDDGRFLGVECKVGKNKLTESQREFAESVRSRNGVYVVARTVDDVRDRIDAEARR